MITNVLEYLENSAVKYPEKTAFADPASHCSYLEALQASRSIGSALLPFGQRRKPAAVLIDRDVCSVLAFFGIVFSGNFYVPVDPKLPAERIRQILKTLDPFCILGSEKQLSALTSSLRETGNYPLLPIETALKTEPDEAALEKIRKTHLDTDPLYTIFTSGSTGIPKGVVITHRSVIDLVEQFAAAFDFQSEEVFAGQAPFDFDVSVKDIYNVIRNGCTLEILPQSFFVMPDGEPQYLGRGFLNNDNVYSGKRYTDTNITIHSWKPRIHTQENKALLDEIITLCQEKGVEIILVSPPLPEVLLSHAGDMNHMHATYQAIADSHGIPFYDMNFYTGKNTVFSRELFRDIVHLNRNGAEIYTRLIAEIHESGDAYPTYFTEEYMGEVAEPAA